MATFWFCTGSMVGLGAKGGRRKERKFLELEGGMVNGID